MKSFAVPWSFAKRSVAMAPGSTLTMRCVAASTAFGSTLVGRVPFAFARPRMILCSHVPHPGRGGPGARALRHPVLRLRPRGARGRGARRARLPARLRVHAALRDEGELEPRRPAPLPRPRPPRRRLERPRGRARAARRLRPRAHPAHLAGAVPPARGVRGARRSLHRLLPPAALRYGRALPGRDATIRVNPGLGSGSTNRTNTG